MTGIMGNIIHVCFCMFLYFSFCASKRLIVQI